MEATGCSHIEQVVLCFIAVLSLGVAMHSSELNSTSVKYQVDLSAYGGRLSRITPRISHAVVLLPSGTTWVAFPIAGDRGLSRREGPLSPGFRFLQLSAVGGVVSQCVWHVSPAAPFYDFFPRKDGSVTVWAANMLVSLDSNCNEVAHVLSPAAAVRATSDGSRLVVETIGGLRMMDAKSLRDENVIDLPPGMPRYHRAFVWNRVLLLMNSPETPCYWTAIGSDAQHVWHTVPCPNESVRLFGDDALISIEGYQAPQAIAVRTLDGTPTHNFPFPNTLTPDPGMFPDDSCVSPNSGRAGVFLFEQKRTLMDRRSITGENVSVIDLRQKRSLVALPVTEGDPLLNCSVSSDGRKMALLRGLSLTVLSLPD